MAVVAGLSTEYCNKPPVIGDSWSSSEIVVNWSHSLECLVIVRRGDSAVHDGACYGGKN